MKYGMFGVGKSEIKYFGALILALVQKINPFFVKSRRVLRLADVLTSCSQGNSLHSQPRWRKMYEWQSVFVHLYPFDSDISFTLCCGKYWLRYFISVFVCLSVICYLQITEYRYFVPVLSKLQVAKNVSCMHKLTSIHYLIFEYSSD